MKYPIVEIFDAPQGEGINLGAYCTFIRFAKCNLACPWCDTNFEKYTELTLEEIMEKVNQDSVILTGGEPLLQDLLPLLTALKAEGIWIGVETNGTQAAKPYAELLDWIACSPKPGANYDINPDTKAYISELKFVVDDVFTLDNLPKELFESNGQETFPKMEAVWLQPEGFSFATSTQKALTFVKDCPVLRLGIQAHKFWEVK
jgi:organic radical activating enzyme